MTNDLQADFRTSLKGPLLAPIRPDRQLGHVNAVDWSECPLAKAFDISGETKGGPGRTWGRGGRRT